MANIDLRGIKLRNQVDLIRLSKKTKDYDELSKKSGMNELHIRHIISHQRHILGRWKKVCPEENDIDLSDNKEEEEVIHQLLLEWNKRAFWNGNEEIGEREIEHEANAMTRIFRVPTFRLSSSFWEEFRAFQLQHGDNQYRGQMHFSLDIDNILRNCESRINPTIYAKFKGILERRTPPKQLRTYPIRRKDVKKCTEKHINVEETDVLIIERPIECIDVEKVTTKSQDNGNGEVDYVKIKNEAICDDEEDGGAGTRANISISHYEDIVSIEKTEYSVTSQNNNGFKSARVADVSLSSPIPREEKISERRNQANKVHNQADQDAVHQLLVEWTKRSIMNGNRVIRNAQIECKANEFKRFFKLPAYHIYTDFWDDLLEFMTLLGNKHRVQYHSMDTEAILKHCRKRINPKTYMKFLTILENERQARSKFQKNNISKKPTKYPALNISMDGGGETSSGTHSEIMDVEKVPSDIDYVKVKVESLADDKKDVDVAGKNETSVTIELDYSIDADSDVILIEQPMECIDVTLEAINNEVVSEDITNVTVKIEPDTEVTEEPSCIQGIKSIAPIWTLKKPTKPFDVNRNNKTKESTSIGDSTVQFDEKRYHELVDQLLFQWARRYILNGRRPELQMNDILMQAKLLQQYLNLPTYVCKLGHWNKILAFKRNEEKMKREVPYPKLSLDYLKILRECEFVIPSNIYLECLNRLENVRREEAAEKRRQLQEMVDYEASVPRMLSTQGLHCKTNNSVVYSLVNVGQESEFPNDDSSIKISYKGNAKCTSSAMYDRPRDMPSSSIMHVASREEVTSITEELQGTETKYRFTKDSSIESRDEFEITSKKQKNEIPHTNDLDDDVKFLIPKDEYEIATISESTNIPNIGVCKNAEVMVMKQEEETIECLDLNNKINGIMQSNTKCKEIQIENTKIR